MTRLICHGPRRQNKCNIEFRDSYNCPLIDLYSGWDYHPNGWTVTNQDMQGNFWVDNSRISWNKSFRVFMHNSRDGENTTYEQVTYQFDY
jgi:hypothetical protein